PELQHSAEVPPAASESPKEVRVVAGAGRAQPAVSGHDHCGQQVVTRRPMLASGPTETAAERESSETGLRDVAGRRSEAELLGGAIELAKHDAWLGTGGAFRGINLDGLHGGEVDHHAVVAHSVARDVVPATPDSERESSVAGQAQRLNHIALMRAAS